MLERVVLRVLRVSVGTTTRRSFSFSVRDELDEDLTRPIATAATRNSSAGMSSSAYSAGAQRGSASSSSSVLLTASSSGESAASSSVAAGADDAPPPWVASARYARQRLAIDEHMKRLQRLDVIALSAAAEASSSTLPGASSVSIDLDVSEAPLKNALPEPGLPVDYCIFCYHGAERLLKHENTQLLSKFVSDRGAILPRRFSHACAKHQRALARTIKRARSINLLPFEAKLHPRARFTSYKPSAAEVALGGSDSFVGSLHLSGDEPVVAQRRAEEAAILEGLAKNV